jgi:hypothetical protein
MTKIPTIVHNGTILTPANTWDNIQDNVVGHGTYVVGTGATLSFLYGVDGGQTIALSNHPTAGAYVANALIIDDPMDFHGHVDLSYVTPPPGAPAANEQSNIGIPMVGVAIDSYSYHNDMLKLWFQDKVVESLHLTVHDPYGITVQAAPGAWIFASANTATQHGIGFLGSPIPYPAMAVHST